LRAWNSPIKVLIKWDSLKSVQEKLIILDVMLLLAFLLVLL